jgi:3-methyladenine DNA glycosylase AlkC
LGKKSMGSLLKDIYSRSFYNRFADTAVAVYPAFDKAKFIRFIFAADWPNMELKERMRHTTLALHQCLPGNFEKASGIITNIINHLRKNGIQESGLEYIFFPDYVEVYGIEHYDVSVKAMEFITQFITCEFAVRPFIIRYGEKMLRQMLRWSLHENDKVRRLASEGVRPRLPWAMAVPVLKKDPSPILPILENLKNDPSEFVRRSVANNLNDISKDHPTLVLAIANKWKGISKETDAIIRHGCRTLLKQANTDMLKYFGVADTTGLQVSKFIINTPSVKIGKSVEFSFTVKNTGNEPRTVRLEYAVLYKKKNGQLSRKVFKISERVYRAKEKCVVVRKQSFKIITTRKFYAGQHKLSVIINGQEKKAGRFELVN